jgi:hypothetical protein
MRYEIVLHELAVEELQGDLDSILTRAQSERIVISRGGESGPALTPAAGT